MVAPVDFGDLAAYATRSKYGKHPLLQYPSRRWPGMILEFMYHSGPNTAGSTFYRCRDCHHLKKMDRQKYGAVAAIKVRKGIIVTDPDYPRAVHYCEQQKIANTPTERRIRLPSEDPDAGVSAGEKHPGSDSDTGESISPETSSTLSLRIVDRTAVVSGSGILLILQFN